MADLEQENGAVDDGAVSERESAGSGRGKGKTFYCAKCHRRFPQDHFESTGHDKGQKDAETVIGAGSGAELGEQARAVIGKKTRKPIGEAKLDAAEVQRRREASIRLGRKLAGAPFSIAVLVTAQPEWRNSVTDEEIADIADAWADFAEAWGVHATGKVVAVVSLAMSYATTGGKAYARVKAKEAAAELGR